MIDDMAQQTLGEIGLNNFAPYLMNRIMGRYNASMHQEMIALGLTTPKIRALAVLAMIDGLVTGDLAVYAVVEHSTLSRALDGLEAENMVRRARDEQDARITRVYITDTGRQTFEQLWPVMARAYAQMFNDITDEERNAFISTLQKILKNVRHHEF